MIKVRNCPLRFEQEHGDRSFPVAQIAGNQQPVLSLARLPRQQLAVGFDEPFGQREQRFRRGSHHFTFNALDDRQAEAVVFNNDAGEGPVHGAE